ncbi:MAG TPA: hypothetical protein VIL32_03430 [Steroidobacteraceae bacterium]
MRRLVTQVARIGTALWMAAALPAAGAALGLPAGSRIGVIDMSSTDVMHFHTSRTATNAFMKTYRVSWPAESEFALPIAAQAESKGFVPVILQPPDILRRNRERYFIQNVRGTRFARDVNAEIERLAAAEQLQALIIVVPGLNESPEAVEGNRLRALPEYVQGWGFTTHDEGNGEPVLFNLTQLLLFEISPDGPRFRHREWGGSYVYAWSSFTPPADLRQMPPEEIDKLQPLFKEIVARQVERLFEQIQPAS